MDCSLCPKPNNIFLPDEMSQGLSRLKGLAQGLGEEIVDQNTLLDRISEKAERADTTIGSQNTQMKKLLKR